MRKKRFTHRKWYDDRQLFDVNEPFAIVDVYIQAEQICDKLNKLAEENKQYQQWLGALREELSLADRDNTALEKENKELRSDREYWKTLAQSLAKNNGNVKLKDEHLAWKRVDVE